VIQPDFTALFFDTFGNASQPIRYELRQPPMLLHDLSFLSSLIHDARLKPAEICRSRGCIELPLNRDCWERGFTDTASGSELHAAATVLTVRSSGELHWLAQPDRDEIWLDYLWVSETYRQTGGDRFELIVQFSGSPRLTIGLADDWSVILQDREMPYLWSQRYC
jgi:hypothetical protein